MYVYMHTTKTATSVPFGNNSEGTQKWTLLGSKVVPPGGPVFGPFILSDVLKFCRLLCAQNVKREATYTNSIRGRTLELFDALVANLVAMMCDADVCSWITTTRLNREFKWDVKQAPREALDSDC